MTLEKSLPLFAWENYAICQGLDVADPNRTNNFPGTGNVVTICWDSMCTPRCQVTIESQENKNIQDWSFKTKELPVDKDL